MQLWRQDGKTFDQEVGCSRGVGTVTSVFTSSQGRGRGPAGTAPSSTDVRSQGLPPGEQGWELQEDVAGEEDRAGPEGRERDRKPRCMQTEGQVLPAKAPGKAESLPFASSLSQPRGHWPMEVLSCLSLSFLRMGTLGLPELLGAPVRLGSSSSGSVQELPSRRSRSQHVQTRPGGAWRGRAGHFCSGPLPSWGTFGPASWGHPVLRSLLCFPSWPTDSFPARDEETWPSAGSPASRSGAHLGPVPSSEQGCHPHRTTTHQLR